MSTGSLRNTRSSTARLWASQARMPITTKGSSCAWAAVMDSVLPSRLKLAKSSVWGKNSPLADTSVSSVSKSACVPFS